MKLSLFKNFFFQEDMNEMERRKRVRQILESKGFRQELESLIVSEKQQGNLGAGDDLRALEQLSELILPKQQLMRSSFHGISKLIP